MKTASTRPSRATTVDLPAWRQQLSSRRGWPAWRTSTCQGSGSRPSFRMSWTGGGRDMGGLLSEVRGQRSEVRGRRSEVRGQRSEVRGQGSGGGGRRSEVLGGKLVWARDVYKVGNEGG